MFILPRFGQWDPLHTSSCQLLTWSISLPALPSPTRHLRVASYFALPRLELSHFFKGSHFCSEEWYLKTKIWALSVLIASFCVLFWRGPKSSAEGGGKIPGPYRYQGRYQVLRQPLHHRSLSVVNRVWFPLTFVYSLRMKICRLFSLAIKILPALLLLKNQSCRLLSLHLFT